MHIRTFFTAILLLACVACGGNSGGGIPPVPGAAASLIYTADSAGSVSAFVLDTDTGGMIAIPGSPFAAPPQAFSVAATPNGGHLYATSFQNSTVTGYSVALGTGVLTALACPAANTDMQPMNMVIDPTGTFLYTENQAGSVSGFTINSNTGCLTAIAGSPFAAAAVPRSIAMDRTGKFLFVAIGGSTTSTINVYSVQAGTGVLTPVAGVGSFVSSFSNMTTSPTADVLFVSDAGGYNRVHVFTINTTSGALAEISGSPYSTGGTDPDGMAVTPSGGFLYVTNTASRNISAFSIASSGALTAVSGSPFAGGVGPISADVDWSGAFLFVTNNGGGTLTTFRIGTSGTLSPGASLATGNGPHVVTSIKSSTSRGTS